MKKLIVNLLYPTRAPGGHGVETAFREMVNGLSARDDVEVMINSWQPADIIHAHSPDPISIIKLLCHRGKPVVSGHLTHGSMVGSLSNWLVPIMFWYYKRFYKLAEAMVAVSAETKQNLIKEFGISVPIKVIENSIDTKIMATTPQQKSEFRRQLGYKDSDFIIVSNGQIQPRKKFDEFVRTARAMGQYKFIWVGGIPFKGLAADQGKLERLVKNSPKNLYATQVIPLEQARKYMRLSDVYFHPAVQETFGIAIVEAAAAGLPVLLRDIADYDHTFRPQAVMSTPQDFQENIIKLATDKKFYIEMSQQARRLSARYDNSAAAQKLVDFYRQILS
ncbi:MAG: glycosyltransferase family 4 protein, partial [Candidatus Nomurabacteria bacterium]|nr:glycosyltransferase family 4 protein [Candidatus Nomurabacteria bacterium]